MPTGSWVVPSVLRFPSHYFLSLQIILVPNASHWGIFSQSVDRLESYWCLATVMADWLSVWLYSKWMVSPLFNTRWIQSNSVTNEHKALGPLSPSCQLVPSCLKTLRAGKWQTAMWPWLSPPKENETFSSPGIVIWKGFALQTNRSEGLGEVAAGRKQRW